MNPQRQSKLSVAAAAQLLIGACACIGQTTDFELRFSRDANNAVLSWNGAGSLQTSADLSLWTDVLAATSPCGGAAGGHSAVFPGDQPLEHAKPIAGSQLRDGGGGAEWKDLCGGGLSRVACDRRHGSGL